MSFWNTVKRGFGYGLGGRLGWELGGAIWSLVRRVLTWLALAISAPFLVHGIGAYQDYTAQHKAQVQHVQQKHKQQQDASNAQQQ